MFRLVRYFSITSLVAFVIVSVLLGLFFRQNSVSDLIALGESKNVALTQTFANSLWPQFAPFVAEADTVDPDDLASRPEIAELREAVLAHMAGLSVVKVKVYNLDGLTVFSTQESQIGSSESDNAGFLAAREGGVATELTHRDTFSAFDREIVDRDLISSYVPIYGSEGQVEGVMEVYDDVTPLLDRIAQTQRTVIVGLIVALGLLYGVLYAIVRRADSLIKQQNIALIRSEGQLSAILNTVGEAILTVTPDGLVTLSNQAAVSMWGHDQAAMLDIRLERLLTPNSWQMLSAGIKEYAGARPASVLDRRLELDGVRADGSTFPLEAYLTETRLGRDVLFTLAARDITERQEAAKKVEEHTRQLERVNEFVRATIEHMLSTVQRGASQSEILQYLQQSQSQFARMG